MERPEQGHYIPYFVPISQRTSSNCIKESLVVRPIHLSPLITTTINSLFHTKEVHLFLPYWVEDGDKIDLDWNNDNKKVNAPTGIKRKLKISEPSGYYEIRFASNNKKIREFIPPYNPLVILDSNEKYIGTIYKGNLFLLCTAKYLLPLLTAMAEKPVEFFEILGKRWGICLCCKKTLTAESSLERSIGPVCYKRIKNIRKSFGMREIQDGDIIEVEEGTIDHNLPSCISLYTPEEKEFLSNFNELLFEFTSAGMYVFNTGLTIAPGSSMNRGDLLLIKPKYKTKQPGEKRGVKYIYYKIMTQTYLTIPTLLTLGGKEIEITLKGNNKCKVFSFPQSYKEVISSMFSVALRSKKEKKEQREDDEKDEEERVKKSKDVKIVEDDDYLYVTGNTYPIKEELKKLGGKWDKNKQAWKFPQGSVLRVDIESLIDE